MSAGGHSCSWGLPLGRRELLRGQVSGHRGPSTDCAWSPGAPGATSVHSVVLPVFALTPVCTRPVTVPRCFEKSEFCVSLG